MGQKNQEMIGKKFGKLTVVSEMDEKGRQGNTLYSCMCDCGKVKQALGVELRRGGIKSCGACNRDAIRERGVVLYKDRIYRIWDAMKQRCYNPNNLAYHNYGGRGVGICSEWRHNYLAFLRWSNSNGYAEKLEIDRIDNDGDYEPSNCKWSTHTEQQRNRRDNLYITINGVTKCLQEWSIDSGINHGTLQRRYSVGWRGEKLLSPVNKKMSFPDRISKAYWEKHGGCKPQ